MGIINLDLNLLKTFLAVAEEKHFTKASHKLFIEQSAVSKSIKRLEQELCTQLFIRTNRQVNLTSKGQALYLRAREIVELSRDFVDFAKDQDKELSGTLKFGAESPISFLYLPSVISKLVKDYPNLWPMMHTETTDSISRKVQNKELEIAFVFYEGERLKELQYTALKQVDFQIVASKKASGEALNSFIGSREIHQKNPQLPTFEKLRKLNQKLTIKYSANDMTAYKELIMNGLGIGFLPKAFIDQEVKNQKLKVLYPHLKLSFPIYLIQHQSYPLSLEAQKLVDLMKE